MKKEIKEALAKMKEYERGLHSLADEIDAIDPTTPEMERKLIITSYSVSETAERLETNRKHIEKTWKNKQPQGYL